VTTEPTNAATARLAYLTGEATGPLADAWRERDLDELAGLLADPSVWTAPPDGLEARVVDAITAEAAATRRSSALAAVRESSSPTARATVAGGSGSGPADRPSTTPPSP
jgi:hypothetical protein